MEIFLDKLRNEISGEENLKDLLPYYATIKQAINFDEFKDMLSDLDNKNYEITYISPDENDWYSDGKFIIYFEDNHEYRYEINLNHDDRDWGYCDCKPTMEMYNHIHKCCGNGCDYTFPKIEIIKVIYKCNHAYDGVAYQLWNDVEEIEAEFSGDKIKLEELHKERQKIAIQEQISLLHKQLEELN